MSRNVTILSAKELFQCRKRENLSVPQRGGAKDYEPDGTWLQGKRLEAHHEELGSVLAEPRVEKSGNLVKGTWNPELKLVNIEKTAKFWMKMGFVDQQRNYLHPEEALFLVEVNCLNLINQGLTLSTQEAYELLLQPACGISEEEYQVYAHLRRLGFIVIRHAGRLDLTQYERKIGLDKHTRKKNKNKSKSKTTEQSQSSYSSENKEKGSKPGSSEDRLQQVCDSQGAAFNTDASYGTYISKDKVSNSSGRKGDSRNCLTLQPEQTNDLSRKETNGDKLQSATETVQTDPNKKPTDKRKAQESCPQSLVSEEPLHKKTKSENPEEARTQCVGVEPVTTPVRGPPRDSWSYAVSQSQGTSQDPSGKIPALSRWDFGVIRFPDIGGGRDTVALAIPPSHLLPPNTGVSEEYEDACMFDVEEYRQQAQPQRYEQFENEQEDRLQRLEFSYAEWCQRHSQPVAARNWKDWKAEMKRQEASFSTESPVSHLWQGDTTPLVKPEESVSTVSLLEKLSVIQPFQGPFPAIPNSSSEKVKISFDVYLPNTSFKKSRPGLPDHRVCVSRGEEPPGVFEVHAATAGLQDNIPLHWAVVNCGEISFFVFSDLDLPIHPSSLG